MASIQVRDIADVTTAVTTGDLSRKITVQVRGEILELKNTINTMVDQLRAFAAEVTRVAREVGTDGILGGQAEVRGVSGMWRELTDNVNVMARNLTEQVRDIARVVTAVADGDLKQKLRLDAKGEIATLVYTIDNMIGTLSTFADQVTGVARDVGQGREPGTTRPARAARRLSCTSASSTSPQVNPELDEPGAVRRTPHPPASSPPRGASTVGSGP